MLLATVTVISGTGSVPLDARLMVPDWITRPVAEIVIPFTVTGSESVDVPRCVTNTATLPVPLVAFQGVPLAPVQLVEPVDQVPSVVPDRLQVRGAAEAAPAASSDASVSSAAKEPAFASRRIRMGMMLMEPSRVEASMVSAVPSAPPSLIANELSGCRWRFAMPRSRRFVPPSARFVPFPPIRPSRAADSSQRVSRTSVV